MSKLITQFKKGHQTWNKGKKTSKRTKQDKWEYQKSWRAKNPDKVRAITKRWYDSHREQQLIDVRKGQLKRKYGFTQELYEVFFFMQCGQCALCLEDWDRKKNFAIDHDHTTGRVRGLLCHRCNLSLGAFKDDVDLLLKAVMYLKKYAKPTR